MIGDALALSVICPGNPLGVPLSVIADCRMANTWPQCGSTSTRGGTAARGGAKKTLNTAHEAQPVGVIRLTGCDSGVTAILDR